MPLKIKDIKIDGYERVVHATDENTQLNCFIAIHNIKLGPALGGTRSWEYENQESQLTDVKRLSEAMTLKNSVCGINFGGGKAALNLKGIKKTSDLYQSYGEAVQALKGIYISAADVGTTKDDLLEIQKKTNYVNGIGIETSAPTARGLLSAIKSTCKFGLKKKDLKNIHIAICGAGKVGGKLAKLLYKEGVKLSIANIDQSQLDELSKDIEFSRISPDEIVGLECDLLSPCALGKAIHKENINSLNCKMIVGAANNQLENDDIGLNLKHNKVVYSPDFLVNSGGVIAISCEINKNEKDLENQLNIIGKRTTEVLEISQKLNKATNTVAKNLAWERINNLA